MSEGQSHSVAPDGTAFDLHGPADAPVVALIHGLGLCRHIWRDHLGALQRHYRIVNYDLYGHGDSAPPPTTAFLMRDRSSPISAALSRITFR